MECSDFRIFFSTAAVDWHNWCNKGPFGEPKKRCFGRKALLSTKAAVSTIFWCVRLTRVWSKLFALPLLFRLGKYPDLFRNLFAPSLKYYHVPSILVEKSSEILCFHDYCCFEAVKWRAVFENAQTMQKWDILVLVAMEMRSCVHRPCKNVELFLGLLCLAKV